jgi:hypothetical protein
MNYRPLFTNIYLPDYPQEIWVLAPVLEAGLRKYAFVHKKANFGADIDKLYLSNG